jgi:hypothetical protein
VSATVSARASARFCSAGFLVRPLDADGWLTITRPSRAPGGKRLSQPRPMLRPGARDALSTSKPKGRFSLRAEWRRGARSAVCASRLWAVFVFGPNFSCEQ